MAGLLRPDAQRGELVAAGAVALALAVWMINLRFEEKWGVGVHFVYSALAATVAINLAAMAGTAGERPRARWHSALFVVSFLLTVAALANLADLLGGDDGIDSSGTIVWVGLLLMWLMGWFSVRFDSGISTLIASLLFVVVLLAFVDWVFSPDGAATFRWVLLAGALALAAFAARGPDRGRHHEVGYANAAGVAVFGIAILFSFDAIGLLIGGDGEIRAETGWELVILAAGLALLAYATWRRQSGPGYLGFLNLQAFVLLAATAGDDGPSLIGWPIVMVLAAIGLLAAGLRPGGPQAR